MKFSFLLKISLIFLAVTCVASADEKEKPLKADAHIEDQASPAELDDPDEQFNALVGAGQYIDAIQIFDGATMQYKVRIVYDLMRKPVDSPEIDLMLVEHLKLVSEIVDEGTESRAARNGASGKILKYLGLKYDFLSPEIDVWARPFGQRGVNKKIKDVMPAIEKALRKAFPAKMVPPQVSVSLPPADTMTGNHPKLPAAPTVQFDSKSSATLSEESTSSTPWIVILILIVGASGLLWLLLKRRS